MPLHLKHPVYRRVRTNCIRLLRRHPCERADRRHNARLSAERPRILFLRDHHPHGDYHCFFLRWLWRHHPDLAARCELRRVGWQPERLDDYALVAPQVQDPCRELYPRTYDRVQALQAACAVEGIPVVNPVQTLSNSRKSLAAVVMRDCGLHCAPVLPAGDARELDAALEQVGFPCILRDDLRHGEMTLLRGPEDLARLDIRSYRDQVVCGFIDTADEHGIYRKYRSVLVGDRSVPRGLLLSRHPVVRGRNGIHDDRSIAEESAFLAATDPNHEALDAARRALGFDIVAFDYSYDRDGRMVVWEPNPLPMNWDRESEAARDRLVHQLPAIERIHATYARYYAERAGLTALLDPNETTDVPAPLPAPGSSPAVDPRAPTGRDDRDRWELHPAAAAAAATATPHPFRSTTMSLHLKHPSYRAMRNGCIGLIRRMTRPRDDRRHNRRLDEARPRILFLRQFHPQGDYHCYFFNWLWQHHPALAVRCELRRVGWRPRSLEDYSLVVPLVQDPCRELFPRTFRLISALQQSCAAANIPVVNRVENLSGGCKSRAAEVIAACGLRCATVLPARNRTELDAAISQVGYPCILRDDLRHGEISVLRGPEDRAQLRFRSLPDQVVCSFIDTADEHGIYRKYRSVLVGERCVPRHLIPSRNPLVRQSQRVFGHDLIAEEIAFLDSEDPNHERLDAARRALGLDIVAFDYSYDREGELVIWEPNPFPVNWDHDSEAIRNRLTYQLPAIERIHAAYARFYAERAGLAHLLSGEPEDGSLAVPHSARVSAAPPSMSDH